ncbi:hypothetical protein [Streptomyces sp. MI02-7b]|uniref:hypothetical protein n=1 Tax=Streptomyces sp. MI02-7b TaxID=462941 RepID=UPI0029A7F6F3|nr:hypothetical protein [Streptomyces sp. MI02-7b]MDX3075884.1 hypothetical protein [Streptomyces sp. MI02-7b]
MHHLTRAATAAVLWVRGRLEEGRARGSDRGDISITTVIIWAAAVGGAIAIAGTISIIVTKYNGLLTGI